MEKYTWDIPIRKKYAHKIDNESIIYEWGIQCSEGWKKIIEEFLTNLEILDTYNNVKIFQIKEKFGKLRIYLTNIPTEIENTVYELIKITEDESAFICEVCARHSKIRTINKFLTTVCDKCLGLLPVIKPCKKCKGNAQVSLYSEGVYVCGCIKDYCNSLPICGTDSEKNAILAWNKWVDEN